MVLTVVRVFQGEFKVTERTLVMKELLDALKGGRVLEVFGAGTACVVCPVGSLLYKGQVRPHSFFNANQIDVLGIRACFIIGAPDVPIFFSTFKLVMCFDLSKLLFFLRISDGYLFLCFQGKICADTALLQVYLAMMMQYFIYLFILSYRPHP